MANHNLIKFSAYFDSEKAEKDVLLMKKRQGKTGANDTTGRVSSYERILALISSR